MNFEILKFENVKPQERKELLKWNKKLFEA